MLDHVVFRRCFSVFCILSACSVIGCVGYHLWLDRCLQRISIHQAPVTQTDPAGEVPDLPAEPQTDENGLPILSDTKYVTNILLIGTDARKPGEYCRSDVMILLSVNRKSQKIIVTSLLRDLYVPIPGSRENRLNTAYSQGGVPLLLSVLRNTFNLDVDQYALVDFTAFVSVIDALGGVDLTVSSSEAAVINRMIRGMNDSGASIPLISHHGGAIHLNGAQALAYVRNRSSINGDFDRTAHQRAVLQSLFLSLKTASPADLLALPAKVIPYITTNLSTDALQGYLGELSSFVSYEVVCASVPCKGSFSLETVDGMAVILTNFKDNICYLYDQIYT